MGRHKQSFKCFDCNKECRDTCHLEQHKKNCKGSAQVPAVINTSTAEHEYRFQRGYQQTRSQSRAMDLLLSRNSAEVVDVLTIDPKDCPRMFVSMIKFLWFNENYPQHHHMLMGGLKDKDCIVFQNGVWQYTNAFTEIRECIHEASTRFYDVETIVESNTAPMEFKCYLEYRDDMENLSGAKSSIECSISEGMQKSTAKIDIRLRDLMNKVTVELVRFTANRGELFERATSEAENNKPAVSSEWLGSGELYDTAISNFTKYKDWLPGKPLHTECLKMIDTYKRTFVNTRKNIEEAIKRCSDVDIELYKSWSENFR